MDIWFKELLEATKRVETVSRRKSGAEDIAVKKRLQRLPRLKTFEITLRKVELLVEPMEATAGDEPVDYYEESDALIEEALILDEDYFQSNNNLQISESNSNIDAPNSRDVIDLGNFRNLSSNTDDLLVEVVPATDCGVPLSEEKATNLIKLESSPVTCSSSNRYHFIGETAAWEEGEGKMNFGTIYCLLPPNQNPCKLTFTFRKKNINQIIGVCSFILMDFSELSDICIPIMQSVKGSTSSSVTGYFYFQCR